MRRAVLLALVCAAVPLAAAAEPPARRPNVLLILTDDQGHGDLGFHGNPKLKTPHLDQLAAQSVRLRYFYVSPVCSPTRASLMTGRYNYRTGVVDTFLGRALMDPSEVTLADRLAAAGYRTAVFGKWHLGDHYPLRPQDRGFQEALVLQGGGIGQPSDPPEGNSYFDPTLQHNGKAEKTKGYVSDVLTDATLEFLSERSDKPFFAYLAFNCPHTPLQVPEAYEAPYRKMDLSHSEFPMVGHPLPGKAQQDVTAKVYGMETNIDDNVGRLLAKLDELKLADDTLVVFLSDNGPQQVRYNSGLLDRKGSVHEGGIRVPCFVRWPGKFEGGRDVDRIAAHVDLAPTLLEACGVARPDKPAPDGVSLLPLLKGDKVDWPDRTLYFQWHRGDEPELGRACAARSQRWKLVQPAGADGGKLPEKLKWELFEMAKDPLEEHDVAADHPDVVETMRRGYEAWFKDVSGTRGYGPVRYRLGTDHEDPVLLTRQDWRGPRAGWGPNDLGYWEVEVARAGAYDLTLRFAGLPEDGVLTVALGDVKVKAEVKKGATEHAFEKVRLPEGPGRLEPVLTVGKETRGVLYAGVKRAE
jgi:arylsulfatase A-like enzyme